MTIYWVSAVVEETRMLQATFRTILGVKLIAMQCKDKTWDFHGQKRSQLDIDMQLIVEDEKSFGTS